MSDSPVHYTRSFPEAIGLAVIQSFNGGVQVVGREAEGEGRYVVGRRLPACIVVGCARDGRWMPTAAVNVPGIPVPEGLPPFWRCELCDDQVSPHIDTCWRCGGKQRRGEVMDTEQVIRMSVSDRLAARATVMAYLRDKTERAATKVLRAKEGDWDKRHKALMKANAEYNEAQNGLGWVKFYDKAVK